MLVSIVMLLLFTGVSVLDGVLAYRSFQKRTRKGWLLGATCSGACFVTVTYLISVLLKHYQLYSVFSSLYFIGIDVSLVLLLDFVLDFVSDQEERPKHGVGWYCLLAYGVFDICVLAINPFREIALHYLPVDGVFVSHFIYEMLPLYKLHLAFAYLLVFAILFVLFGKILGVPSGFRERYFRAIGSILLVVGINALYLYWPGKSLDYSLLGYSLVAMILYMLCFGAAGSGITRSLQNWLFSCIDQGIVLFDYNNELAFKNTTAERLLTDVEWQERMHIRAFATQCGLAVSMNSGSDHQVLQCYMSRENGVSPLRCEFSALTNERREVMGRLFVFTDLTSEADPLTGFYNRRYFTKNLTQLVSGGTEEIDAVVFDINRLMDVNDTQGRDKGDQMIKRVSEIMRESFPDSSLMIRGREAVLAAVCIGQSKQTVDRSMEEAVKAAAAEGIHMQSAQFHGKSVYDTPHVIEKACQVLNIKKLMDMDSRHSALLGILVQALQVCDKDTEAHVRRTQHMGAELGRRIGLTDEQQSNLALLAILHDIGKIGIPLDILNKPGRLTDSEWRMLKTHAEKGYQIANRSIELRDIAQMILHHHEHWDGSGYPDGMRKETIPLLSRIIAVVDAYDAMTNDRAYRKAMSREEACAELKRCAGTQFDPFIVSNFLHMIRQMPEDVQAVAPAQTTQEQPAGEQEGHLPASVTLDLDAIHVHPMIYTRYLLDEDMHIISADSGFEQLTGYTPQEAIQNGLTQGDLIFEEDRAGYFSIVGSKIPKEGMAYLEHRLRRKDGQARQVFCLGRLYYDSSVRMNRTELIVSDSTDSYAVQTLVSEESSKAQRRLEQWESKYRSDALTGLLNHEAFRSDVEQYLLRHESGAMMLMMDVDKFKEFNDTNGHRAGDEQLILVAQTLHNSLRSNDFCCRMGGDEFAAVLTFGKDVPQETMIRRAQQICDSMNMTIGANSSHLSTISMGGAFFGGEIVTFDKLYEAADKALYRAKNAGRSRFSL